MPRVWVRSVLFSSSYIPLMLIFADLNWNRQREWAIGILVFAVLCFGVTWGYLSFTATHANPDQRQVLKVQQREGEVLNYIAAYIIPFVTLPFDTIENGIAVLILLGTLGIIYVRSNMIAINPTLSLLGYHLYAVTFAADEESHVVIARRTIVRGRPITVARLGNVVYIQLPERMHTHDPNDSDPPAFDGD
ncbi:MAG: hypothetical protein H0X24_25530 [Ktedonobacterales bacterium]|nr:hypothetical protein [Ktedonobacterales bacterium]